MGNDKKNRDKNPKSLIRANVNGKKNRGQNTFRANALKTGRKMQKIRCTKTKKTCGENVQSEVFRLDVFAHVFGHRNGPQKCYTTNVALF